MADVDLDNLTVGDSWVRYYPYSDEQTTITLQRVQSGVKTSKYSKPDKGMTTLAAFFTFEANEAGGTSCVSANPLMSVITGDPPETITETPHP